jgi:hypothetical protein
MKQDPHLKDCYSITPGKAEPIRSGVLSSERRTTLGGGGCKIQSCCPDQYDLLYVWRSQG